MHRFLATISSPGFGIQEVRPHATTSADGRYLSLYARRNRTATLAELGSSLVTSSATLVSRSSERRRFHERGLYARRPAICVPLGATNGDAPTYRDDILGACLSPYAPAIVNAFVQQDNNVRPHKVRIIDVSLEQEIIQCMWWPARSPDLYPAEHIWTALG
ncbi:HTH_Tnp_Tc3_2 domain-containing protein [Trichonephila clavipes]|nr:HTH_Tnp_Tc3_2 domain-containing protein [Trichonephila clavipes]